MLRLTLFCLAPVLVAASSLQAYAQQPIIYPSRGQSAEQQQRDQGECMAWAQQTSGVNPTAVAQGLANQPPQQQRGPLEDERLQGALVGALGGLAIGAISGNNAGKGAAIGAVVGTVAGGVHQQQKDQAVQAQTYANQQQAQQALTTYNRAYAACLEGRDYTVK
jgi:YMGG-like Gly-zipper